MNDSLINGLKSNVARGFGIAEFWENTYKKKALPNLLKSWKAICAESGDDTHPIVEEMAWETVNAYTHYQRVDSEDIGLLSIIKMMVIPARTYKNKKGETKTTPEQQVPAHYTHDGDYIGRVSEEGEHPKNYQMNLQITKRHFEFSGVGKTLEDCFSLIHDGDDDETIEFKTKDITKAERKEIKEYAKAHMVAVATARLKGKKQLVLSVKERDDE
jgi:hypothetical protein